MYVKTKDILNLPALIHPHSACQFVIKETEISNCVNGYRMEYQLQTMTLELNEMQAPCIQLYQLAAAGADQSLNTWIIWNKSSHESCMLMATETIAMHGLTSLLNHSQSRVWQKTRSFLETSLAILSSPMNRKYTTGQKLIRISSLHFKNEVRTCAAIFIALIIGSKKLFE